MSRQFARLLAFPPWAVAALVLAIGASTWLAIAACRAPVVARPQVPAVAGSTRDGIFSIGDLERWRDFVLEVEFTPVRGVSRFYWRLGRIVNDAPDELTIGEPDGAWHHGETYVVTATYIGSRRLFEFSPNTQRDPDYVPGIGWRKTRVGAFGAVLSQSSELHVSGLRLKLLR